MQRRQLLSDGLHAVLGLSALTATPLIAQTPVWPSKALRLIVPFPPGGTTDNVSRLVALELGKSLGQAVIVDNKPGAGTVIGVDAAAKAAPDGYTLVCVANSYCVNQTLIKKLPYSAQDLRNGIGYDANLDCTVDDCSRGANRYALSFGMKYAFNPSTTFKAEYRLDSADRPVFIDAKDGTFHKRNQLVGASVVVFF